MRSQGIRPGALFLLVLLSHVSSRLAEMGYITSQGTPFSAGQIKRLLEG
jgi:hypothetical protein